MLDPVLNSPFFGLTLTAAAWCAGCWTQKKTGLILSGLGLVFVGLSLMSDSMKSSQAAVQGLFETVTNPFLLLLAGVLLTALVQSSSATTSIIIAMSVAGLTVGTGGNEVLFIILGTNIGSCATALMSSFSAGSNAKRAGIIHFLFNALGSMVFFAVLLCWPGFMEDTFRRWFPAPATQIAMFHTFFNVTCTALFLPFCGWFVKISELLVKERRAPASAPATFLDERMLSSASLAMALLDKELVRLSDAAMDAFRAAYRSFQARDKSQIAPTQKKIDEANATAQGIINYLIRNEAGILITILNFGIRQLLLLFVVSIAVAAAASYVPVKRIASKRPIDAIRNR